MIHGWASLNVAYFEMRVLVSKFLYSFKFELAKPEHDWLPTKKAYSSWNNNGLRLCLRPRFTPTER